MGRPRQELQNLLTTIVPNVYFQPPESIKMVYPCIVYKLAQPSILHADNIKYRVMNRYTLTLIDRNPDSIYYDAIMALPYSSFDRHFNSDDLNHFVFELYF